MSKYAKILGRLLMDAVLFALVTAGVGGATYALLAPEEGQVVRWLREGWERAPGFLLALVIAAVALFFLTKPWLDQLELKERAGNLLVHAWALLGLLFSLHWLGAVSLS